MTLSDVTASLEEIRRCDDGSDENIANPCVADKAVLMAIGRMEAIATVRLKVALSKAE